MRILIAEDDVNIRTGLEDLLEMEGYECIKAIDGEEALLLFDQCQPDIVLLDIMMPKVDGYTVCRKIRQVNESVPVIFITAKSEEIDQVLGLELGADDYIKKPFGTREVVARIRAVSRRALKLNNKNEHSAGESDFEMNGLIVYPSQLRAVRHNEVIDLSLRDIKILTLLSEKEGKVVSRDSLFDYCWGRDYLPSSRTLDQHISKLRKLIEVDPKHPEIIQTVHGVGYRYDKK